MTDERFAEMKQRFRSWGATCGEYQHVDDMAEELLDEVERLRAELEAEKARYQRLDDYIAGCLT